MSSPSRARRLIPLGSKARAAITVVFRWPTWPAALLPGTVSPRGKPRDVHVELQARELVRTAAHFEATGRLAPAPPDVARSTLYY